MLSEYCFKKVVYNHSTFSVNGSIQTVHRSFNFYYTFTVGTRIIIIMKLIITVGSSQIQTLSNCIPSRLSYGQIGFLRSHRRKKKKIAIRFLLIFCLLLPSKAFDAHRISTVNDNIIAVKLYENRLELEFRHSKRGSRTNFECTRNPVVCAWFGHIQESNSGGEGRRKRQKSYSNFQMIIFVRLLTRYCPQFINLRKIFHFNTGTL